jgi:nucleotide-binding universal stress UspA family protein
MRHVLVPIDGSDPSDAALAFALDRHADAELTALFVVDPTSFVHESAEVVPPALVPTDLEAWREDAEAHAQELLGAAADRAGAAGVALETDVVYGAPARAIVQYADDHDVDQIVVGSHGRDGVSRVLLGSVAETVVRRSPVPVTVVR